MSTLRKVMSRGVLSLVGGAFAFLAVPVQAAPPPFPGRKIELIARGQKIDQILKDLFGQAGLKVVVSNAVTGNLQGKFVDTPGMLWSQFARAFNMVAYYDGAVVRVYSGSEIRSLTLSADSPSSVVSEVNRLRLNDANNSIRAGANNVVASGVPIFLEKVQLLSSSRVAARPSPPAVTPVTPRVAPQPPATRVATGDVVSPAAGRGAGPKAGLAPTTTTPAQAAPVLGPSLPGGTSYARSPIRSTVRTQATARFPYEIRIFYLRYARAEDTVRNIGGKQVMIQGLASQIRGIFGDGRPPQSVITQGNFDRGRYAISQGVGMNGGSTGRTGPDGELLDRTPYDDRGRGELPERFQGDVNGPRIEVDVPNNAIIVKDRPEAMPQIENMVASLDIEPTMVELEATIIDLNTTRAKELGLDFGFSTGGINMVFGGALQTAQSGRSGTLQTSYLTGPGSLFTLRLTALEKSGTARVVSKPRVTTLNNIEAVFGTAREIFLPITSERAVDLRKVSGGVLFRVKPSVIHDGGELRSLMEIYIEDGSVARAEDGNPEAANTFINTMAIIKQGEAIIVGGMTVVSEYDNKQKMPGVGDIPVAGNLFKKRNKGGGRIERLFLITPRIMTLNSPDGAQTVPASQLVPIEQLEGKRKKK